MSTCKHTITEGDNSGRKCDKKSLCLEYCQDHANCIWLCIKQNIHPIGEDVRCLFLCTRGFCRTIPLGSNMYCEKHCTAMKNGPKYRLEDNLLQRWNGFNNVQRRLEFERTYNAYTFNKLNHNERTEHEKRKKRKINDLDDEESETIDDDSDQSPPTKRVKTDSPIKEEPIIIEDDVGVNVRLAFSFARAITTKTITGSQVVECEKFIISVLGTQ